MAERDIAGTHRFVVRVDGVPGSWRTAEPPSRTAETREVFDGGDQEDAIVVADRPKRGEMTLQRGYDPAADGPQLVRLDKQVGRLKTSIRVQDIDVDRVPIGAPRVYQGTLREVQHPSTDADSTDDAMWGLVFHISRFG